MKTLSLFFGIMLFAATSVFANPGIVNKKSNAHVKGATRQTMVTISLTAVAIHTPPAGYRIILTSSTGAHYTQGFPTAGGTIMIMISKGTYTAVIAPVGGAGSTHNFHALDCVMAYNTTGTQASWKGLDFNSCTTGQFDIQ